MRAVALVGLLALAACGASGGDSASPAGPSSTSAAPGGDAAAKYAELVVEPNCAAAQFLRIASGYPEGTPIKEMMPGMTLSAGQAADAYTTFAKQLAAIDWPTAAQAPAEAVIAQAERDAMAYGALANAPDEATFSEASSTLQDQLGEPRHSAALRAALGLDGGGLVADAPC